MKAFPISSAVDTDLISSTASGSTLGLEQKLLANAGQPALTVLAVGFTNTGKVQGVSLGDGNVIEVYASGADYNAGTVLYREFMSLGEPICFTGLSNGAIITSTNGFYGFSEQVSGANESPMPLLSYGLSFKSTFMFAFRNSRSLTGVTNQGYVRVVNGPLANVIKLSFGDGSVVNNQENIKLEPWEFVSLQTLGNVEYIISGTNSMMACAHARTNNDGSSPSQYYDSRLVMPLTNDGITWPRSGFVSAPYEGTRVDWYVRDGAKFQPARSLITTRTNLAGNQATLDSIIDIASTYSVITFTTPAVAPSVNNVGAIWESGGTGVGCSLVLNENFGLSIRWGASVGVGIANDGLTSALALSPNTQYTAVVEFDVFEGEVRLHYSPSADASFFNVGRTPEDSILDSGLSDISGTGEFSVGGSGDDVGGYSVAPSTYLFAGTIDSNYELFSIRGTSLFVSPGSPVDFDGSTGADDASYRSSGATRLLASGLISAYSGADGAGSEASPLMPTSAMSQVIAQPLFIADNSTGASSSISIASPYAGTAKVYEWDYDNQVLILAYTVPLIRTGVTVVTGEDQKHPAAGQISNETTASNTLVGQLNAGVIIADVPITVVVQNGLASVGPSVTLRSQNGETATAIIDDDDETLSLGWTPANIKAEITEDVNGILYRRSLDAGVETWVQV